MLRLLFLNNSDRCVTFVSLETVFSIGEFFDLSTASTYSSERELLDCSAAHY